MIEDRTIILSALQWQRRWLSMGLDMGLAPSEAVLARHELARTNAEIARRCWNRLAIRAAGLHSPIGPTDVKVPY